MSSCYYISLRVIAVAGPASSNENSTVRSGCAEFDDDIHNTAKQEATTYNALNIQDVNTKRPDDDYTHLSIFTTPDDSKYLHSIG